MANRLLINSSFSAAIDVSETVDSKVYSIFQADQIVGSRGGQVETTYTDAKASKYTGVVTAVTSTDVTTVGLVKTGTDPSASGVKAYCVTYDSAVGTPGVVKVLVGSVEHAELAPGEGCVIPLVGGTLADMHIMNAGYVVSTAEATCTCVIIGD